MKLHEYEADKVRIIEAKVTRLQTLSIKVTVKDRRDGFTSPYWTKKKKSNTASPQTWGVVFIFFGLHSRPSAAPGSSHYIPEMLFRSNTTSWKEKKKILKDHEAALRTEEIRDGMLSDETDF